MPPRKRPRDQDHLPAPTEEVEVVLYPKRTNISVPLEVSDADHRLIKECWEIRHRLIESPYFLAKNPDSIPNTMPSFKEERARKLTLDDYKYALPDKYLPEGLFKRRRGVANAGVISEDDDIDFDPLDGDLAADDVVDAMEDELDGDDYTSSYFYDGDENEVDGAFGDGDD